MLFLRKMCSVGTLAIALMTMGCAGNELKASTGQYLDDRAITAKVKTKLIQSSETRGLGIDVDTFKGRVLLGGFANSEQERTRAVELAREVPGVLAVDSAMKLKTEGKELTGAQRLP